MTTTATRLLTAAELPAMPRGYGKRYELIRGELVAKMPTGNPHGIAVKWISFALTEYEVDTGYGQVKTGQPGYRLEAHPDTVRAPDVAWIAPGRIPPGTRATRTWPPTWPLRYCRPDQTCPTKRRCGSATGLAKSGWRSPPLRSAQPAIAPANPPLPCTRTTHQTAATCCPASASPSGARSAAIARPAGAL